jgi:hypothetical protein
MRIAYPYGPTFTVLIVPLPQFEDDHTRRHIYYFGLHFVTIRISVYNDGKIYSVELGSRCSVCAKRRQVGGVGHRVDFQAEIASRVQILKLMYIDEENE